MKKSVAFGSSLPAQIRGELVLVLSPPWGCGDNERRTQELLGQTPVSGRCPPTNVAGRKQLIRQWPRVLEWLRSLIAPRSQEPGRVRVARERATRRARVDQGARRPRAAAHRAHTGEYAEALRKLEPRQGARSTVPLRRRRRAVVDAIEANRTPNLEPFEDRSEGV